MQWKAATLAAATMVALPTTFGAATAPARPSGARPGGTLVATIRVATPRDVKAGFGSIWVSGGPSNDVIRIDPATRRVTAVIRVPDPASVLAVGAGAVWVTSFPGNSVTRIDPRTNTARDTISPGGLGPIGITFFHGYVWVANVDGEPTGSVAKIDPKRMPMRIVELIPVGQGSDAGPSWIAGAAGSLWVSVPNLDAVVRLDPHDDAIAATIHVKGLCGELVGTRTAVWVAGGSGPGCFPAVTRIDPASSSVTDTVNTAAETGALALGAGGLWYGTTTNLMGRLDPATDAILGKLRLPGPSFGAIAAYGFVWITDTDDNRLYQIRPT